MLASSLPTFSFTIICILFLMLCGSGFVFNVLTRRWTTHRPLEALREWARDRDFKLQLPPNVPLPLALQGLLALQPRVELLLSRGDSVLVRLTTTGKSAAPKLWHLLIQQSTITQNFAGLRPIAAEKSVLDIFSLQDFPSLLPPERFVVCAIDSKTARQMAASPVRGLIPADVGWLVHGQHATLDFSARPFDAIEFDRMLAVMEQINRFDTLRGTGK